jgi:hypothetical protein
MLTLQTRLKGYLDGHESDIFGYMFMWAQNELEPQVQAANRPRHEAALFLLTHAFIQTFMDKTYNIKGPAATEGFLKRFIDGTKRKDQFARIASEMHEMRNVMAHQLYSSKTHDIAFDYRLTTGWDKIAGRLHINPKIYGDNFLASLNGGRLRHWQKFTTRVALTHQKYRFIIKWLDLKAGDLLRQQTEQLFLIPNVTAIRKAEKPLRKAFRARYGV